MPTARTRLGDWGEAEAGRFLQNRGYRIVATNYRCAFGEVDIVAQDRTDLVFVEVRTRHNGAFGAPEESLSTAKVRRLLATCQHYVQEHGLGGSAWRIDLVCIHLGRGRRVQQIRHLRHAVQL